MPNDIMVFCSPSEPLSDGTRELLCLARRLAGEHGLSVSALYIGNHDPKELSRKLAPYGCQTLYCINKEYDIPYAGSLAKAAAQFIKNNRPDVLLFSATNENRVIAPEIAARVNTGLTADLCDLSIESDGLLHQTRPAFGGSLTAEIICRNTRPQMATVHPATFQKGEPIYSDDCEIVNIDVATSPDIPKLLSLQPIPKENGVTGADVILAGGAPLGSEGFELLKMLCQKTGSALGATRAAVNAGLAPYSCQIGQTGVTVRPKLYVSFAISGAIQHIAGMKNSEYIIAVDTDRKAPIRDYANEFVIADAKEVLKKLLES